MKLRNKLSRRLAAFLLCAVVTVGALTMAAGAAGSDVTAQLSPDVTVTVDGTAQTFYNVNGDEVHPILYSGTTYLPVRAIGELMGKNVNWDASTRTVSLSGTRTSGTVSGTPDSGAAPAIVTARLSPDVTVTVDGVTRSFTDAAGNTVYPLLYNGSVYLPIRAIGSLMGKSVSWDAAARTVSLSGGDSPLVTDADSFNNSTGTGLITEDRAREIALTHAGLTADQASFVRAKLDWDDGRQVYDVEFYTADYKEYDYEIDAASGEILSFDYDAEHYAPGSGSGTDTGDYIGEAEAKRIALAEVSGAADSDVRYARLDWDDGRAEYEVKIVLGTTEYEFEIDAVTGVILSRDSDSIYD